MQLFMSHLLARISTEKRRCHLSERTNCLGSRTRLSAAPVARRWGQNADKRTRHHAECRRSSLGGCWCCALRSMCVGVWVCVCVLFWECVCLCCCCLKARRGRGYLQHERPPDRLRQPDRVHCRLPRDQRTLPPRNEDQRSAMKKGRCPKEVRGGIKRRERACYDLAQPHRAQQQRRQQDPAPCSPDSRGQQACAHVRPRGDVRCRQVSA